MRATARSKRRIGARSGVRVRRSAGPVPTFGLTHVAFAVRDPNRAARFYQRVLGAKRVYASSDVIQVQTPGSYDVLVFQRDGKAAGTPGGIAHVGFRLRDRADIDRAVRVVKRAGGTIRDQGEFCPGEPYVFFTDPDGYRIEIWHELPTPHDPAPRSVRSARRRT